MPTHALQQADVAELVKAEDSSASLHYAMANLLGKPAGVRIASSALSFCFALPYDIGHVDPVDEILVSISLRSVAATDDGHSGGER